MDLTPLATRGAGLLTDLYQLTMAEGYLAAGMADRRACFALTFRKHPFGGGYTVAAGLADVVAALRGLRFDPDEIAWLRALRGPDGAPLLSERLLDRLAHFAFTCDVDAVEEGTVVFPHTPLVRVTGPLWQAQLVETLLLNLVNFPTLIATKAARVCRAARGKPVLEFGLRRAQGPDGGLTASRAAFIGGCVATSNVLAAMRHGIPVRGTHAHAWVMAFGDERAAFQAYADALPGNVTLLVDTYDTLDGVRHAIEVGRTLRARGKALVGIRLDSGDLCWLSQQARRLLDEAGFSDTRVVASNDLDEVVVESLEAQGACIDVYGVGTELVTGGDQPALGGVYKLTAIDDGSGRLTPRVKLSSDSAKTSVPGVLTATRFARDGRWLADVIHDVDDPPVGPGTELVDPGDALRRRTLPDGVEGTPLLVPVFRDGVCVYDVPTLTDSQRRCRAQVDALDPSVTRLVNPHRHPAGLARPLADRRTALVAAARSSR